MARWTEVTARDLFNEGNRVLWTGLNETTTMFVIIPGNPDRGMVIKTSKFGKVLWGMAVVKGSHAYRVTADGVKRLPLVENDPNAVRRLARTLRWPLTRIQSLSEGEVFSYRPRCQGDDWRYVLPEGENIAVVTLYTSGNPEWESYIFVRKGFVPSWEEVQMALRRHASHYEEPLVEFDQAVAKYKMR